jgi:hypothetical protein
MLSEGQAYQIARARVVFVCLFRSFKRERGKGDRSEKPTAMWIEGDIQIEAKTHGNDV